ncbi:helix-turn-helix transcriptional regulator [Haloglycomyces albus]|uniref:helix-turn-helix transcriptional regulator n=1 Tax=Haloglycomyces albus TaxID=526067 RepID=UPI00046C9BFA|nr:WYL domain-containing protein [Haloglycomyces albus]
MTRSTDRLARLFNLLPYLSARPDGVDLRQAAHDFSISVEQLRSDLMLLFLCGLPGYSPGDLVDIVIDADQARVRFDAGLSRPVRLSQREALALTVALQALASTPGVEDVESIESASHKIATAAGGVRAHADFRDPVIEDNVEAGRELVASGRAARITYYTASRDTTSERVVEPISMDMVDGHAYLQAWCRSADAIRHFRLDRIDAMTILDERIGEHRRSRQEWAPFWEDLSEVELLLDGDAMSLAEDFYCRDLGMLDGRRHIALRVYDEAWAVRLISSYAGHVTVLSPESLRNTIVSQARAALEQY